MGLAFACSLVLAGPPPGTPGMVPLAIPAMTLLLLSPGCTSAVFLTAPAACDRRLELGTLNKHNIHFRFCCLEVWTINHYTGWLQESKRLQCCMCGDVRLLVCLVRMKNWKVMPS